VETANEYGFSSPYSNGREEMIESQKAHRFLSSYKASLSETNKGGIISFVIP
jgi:hypothetical protein